MERRDQAECAEVERRQGRRIVPVSDHEVIAEGAFRLVVDHRCREDPLPARPARHVEGHDGHVTNHGGALRQAQARLSSFSLSCRQRMTQATRSRRSVYWKGRARVLGTAEGSSPCPGRVRAVKPVAAPCG